MRHADGSTHGASSTIEPGLRRASEPTPKAMSDTASESIRIPVSGMDWLVIFAGLAAIGWVNWYFFVAGRTPALAVVSSGAGGGTGLQEQTIVVDGGYSPAVVRVKAGRPVRLIFDRRDNGSCSEEVVFPDFGIRKFLPTGEKTVVEVTPPQPGRYDFACGMSMLRGALVAEE